MKIVFNYNNSDFRTPPVLLFFSPVCPILKDTYRSAGVTAAASGALSRSPGERRAVAAEPACCEAAPPAGCYRDLCGNNFSDGTLATSTVRFWWFRKVLIFRLLQRLKNRGVEVVEKFFAYFHGAFCNGLIFRIL